MVEYTASAAMQCYSQANSPVKETAVNSNETPPPLGMMDEEALLVSHVMSEPSDILDESYPHLHHDDDENRSGECSLDEVGDGNHSCSSEHSVSEYLISD